MRALHVNYGLRGEESDGDERHVRELCAALGVGLDVHRAAPAPVRGNLQAWARDLRYAQATLLAHDSALIATGHTASDQAETVLYRLAASPGRRALLGMAPREGRLVRPLLAITREQTAAHCRARGLDWREDSSNEGQRFARSRVRHGLLAELRRVHPAAERNLLASVEILRAEADVLNDAVAAALGGDNRIDTARLAELPPALARLVVIRLAEDAAGAPVPSVGARVQELLDARPTRRQRLPRHRRRHPRHRRIRRPALRNERTPPRRPSKPHSNSPEAPHSAPGPSSYGHRRLDGQHGRRRRRLRRRQARRTA